MSNKELKYFDYYRFRLVDGIYLLTDSNVESGIAFSTFSQFLQYFNIDIPYYIRFCIIELPEYRIKFRQFGNSLIVYIQFTNINIKKS